MTNVTREHNHAGDPASAEAYQFMNEMKDKSEDSREAPHFLISNAVSQVSQTAAGDLPSPNSIKRTVCHLLQN